jgi:hypothetical protein
VSFPPPQRPQLPPEEPARGGGCVSIALGLTLALLTCIVLFFLTIGFFGMVLVIVGGIFAFAAVHYLVWGWWLSGVIRDDVGEDDDRQ